uniref:Uncharacterized protein n=1 Tax=Gossypium raimondii TaxID=29730 RepID=A0A0D2UVQ7_GOSRA|nr:hypothetical protein B456_011G203100 [Gossypium raimondii]
MSLMHAKKVKLSHLFNTFFYKKLVNLESGYNYRAIKRWTSQRKLGYCLLDCDKLSIRKIRSSYILIH